MKTLSYKSSVYVFIIAIIALGLWSYIQAAGNELTVCVKKDGTVHVIGPEYKRDDCKKNESLLTWNIQGQKGDRGDQGEQGLMGPQGPSGITGAGNIAFIDANFILTTDGTYYNNNSGILQPVLNIPALPIPVSDIVQIVEDHHFLDKNGNYWSKSPFTNTWINLGHP